MTAEKLFKDHPIVAVVALDRSEDALPLAEVDAALKGPLAGSAWPEPERRTTFSIGDRKAILLKDDIHHPWGTTTLLRALVDYGGQTLILAGERESVAVSLMHAYAK